MTGIRIEGDLAGCADLVSRGDPDRFRATMAAVPEARRVLFPLYAFNLEVARAPWVTQESMIAEMRLQWWRDALEEIAEGGPVRRHEVVTPLAAVLDRSSARQLDVLVAARRWDIYRDPFDDAAALERYISDTSGGLMVVASRMLGAAESGAVADVGYASGLASFLNAVPRLEAQGRVPMVDGRPEAVAALAQDGLARLISARARGIPKEARPALLAGWMAEPVLRRAANQPLAVKDGALGFSEFRKSLRLAWCALTGRV